MFSSRNLVFGVALLAIIWAAFVISGRYYVSQQIVAAQEKMDHGKHQEAIEILAAADRFQPNNPNVQFQLAVAHRRKGERDNFFAHLEHAQKLGFNSDPRVNMQTMLYQAQTGEAVDSIATQFNDAPDDVATPDFADQVCEAIARGYVINSELDKAENVLQAWLRHRKDAVIPRIWLANIYQLRMNYAEAGSYYKEAIELDPYNVDAVCDFVEMVNIAEGATDESREFGTNALNRCLEENADNARLLVVAAEHAYKLSEYERAEELAARALECLPSYEAKGAATLLMGRIKLNAGEYEDAVEFLNSSVALNPLSAEPYSLLALAYRSISKNDQADLMSRKADEMKEVNGRVQTLTDELSVSPGDVNKMLEVAGILYNNNHTDDAAKWWLSVLRVDAKNEAARSKLARFYRDQGRDDLAEIYSVSPDADESPELEEAGAEKSATSQTIVAPSQ